MLKPGDVVKAPFVGAVASKMRPTVVISTDQYQANRADVILSLLTSRLHEATTPTDYLLRDWAVAGLHSPSAFRVYVYTILATRAVPIGRLSDRDWQEVQARLRMALAVT